MRTERAHPFSYMHADPDPDLRGSSRCWPAQTCSTSGHRCMQLGSRQRRATAGGCCTRAGAARPGSGRRCASCLTHLQHRQAASPCAASLNSPRCCARRQHGPDPDADAHCVPHICSVGRQHRPAQRTSPPPDAAHGLARPGSGRR